VLRIRWITQTPAVNLAWSARLGVGECAGMPVTRETTVVARVLIWAGLGCLG
jgi:hypothetical protein